MPLEKKDPQTLQQERIRRRLERARSRGRGVKLTITPMERMQKETQYQYQITPRRDPTKSVEGVMYYRRAGKHPKSLEVSTLFPKMGLSASTLSHEDLAGKVLKPAEIREAIGKTFKRFPRAEYITGERSTGIHTRGIKEFGIEALQQMIRNPALKKTKVGRALGLGFKLFKKGID